MHLSTIPAHPWEQLKELLSHTRSPGYNIHRAAHAKKFTGLLPYSGLLFKVNKISFKGICIAVRTRPARCRTRVMCSCFFFYSRHENLRPISFTNAKSSIQRIPILSQTFGMVTGFFAFRELIGLSLVTTVAFLSKA
jgi:hypothetical protein